MRNGRAKTMAVIVAAALVAAACGGGGSGEAEDAGETTTTSSAPTSTTAGEPEGEPEPAAPEEDPDRDGDGVLNDDDEFPDDATRTVGLTAVFPVVDGVFQLPEDQPSVQAYRALEALVRAPELDVDAAHALFDRAVFPDAGQIAAGFATVVPQLPETWDVIDVRAVTPWWMWVMIGDPGSAGGPVALVRIGLDPNSGLINEFSMNPFARGLNGVIYAADRQLDTAGVMAAIDGRTSLVAALVARVEHDGCDVIAGVNEALVLNTASVYKLWVLGAAAELVTEGSLSPDETISFAPGEFMSGGARTTGQFTSPIDLTAQATADLMMGQSDNGATDLLERRVGREAMWDYVDRSGHTQPELLNPIIGIRDYDHLFGSVPQSQVDAFVSGTEDEQRQILLEVIEPLGAVRAGGFGNPNVLDYTWKASPVDICEAMATMRSANPNGSPGAAFIDQAFGAESAIFGIREHWDRVWYKGGGIPSFQPNSNVIFTHASLVESDEHGAYAVITMFNDPVGFSMENLPFEAQSWMARLHQILVEQR